MIYLSSVRSVPISLGLHLIEPHYLNQIYFFAIKTYLNMHQNSSLRQYFVAKAKNITDAEMRNAASCNPFGMVDEKATGNDAVASLYNCQDWNLRTLPA